MHTFFHLSYNIPPAPTLSRRNACLSQEFKHRLRIRQKNQQGHPFLLVSKFVLKSRRREISPPNQIAFAKSKSMV